MPFEEVDCKVPTRVFLGAGAVDRLGDTARELDARKVLCVTDPAVAAAGHLDRALRSLEGAGLAVAVFDGVRENPTTREVDAGLAVARQAGVDFFIGLGGGSAMDCAKGINFLYCCGGRMEDYRGKGTATAPLRGMVAVPTTSGTGSEVQSFALISDPQTHEKMACGDRSAAPKAAVLDPELTLTLPHSVTAATGLDAISHAVETLVSRAATPLSRDLSLRAWRLLNESFERVVKSPGELSPRADMLLGATLAGAAIEHSMLGAAHAAANPLSARHGMVHGAAVGCMLPHVIRFNSPAAAAGYGRLLESAGLPAAAGADPAAELAAFLERLIDVAGLPRRLRFAGVDESSVNEMAEEAAAQWTAGFNPRPATPEDFLRLYRQAL